MRRAGILLLLAAAVAAEDVPKHEPGEDAPRGTVLEWTSRQKRPFQYRLPETIDPERPPNLLVMTHGTGMGYQWAFWNYPVTKGWRPDDIIVAPSAIAPNRGFFQAKPDETEVLDVVKLFRKRFPVGNIYIYGHSQGAFLAPGYEQFLVHVRGYLEKPDDGDRPPSDKERAAYDALTAERKPQRKEGRKAAEEVTRGLVEELRIKGKSVPPPR